MANLTGIPPLSDLASSGVVTSYAGIEGVEASATVGSHGGPSITITLHDTMGNTAATIIATYEPVTFTFMYVVVDAGKRLSGMSASRLNRILSGYGVPKVEWYHRTKSMAVRARGSALSLPATITVAPHVTGGYEWNVLSADGTSSGRTAPAAPTLGVSHPVVPPSGTPSPSIREVLVGAPTGPDDLPVPAGLSGGTTVREVRREVKAEPVTVRVAPPPSDPLGLLTFPTPSPTTAVELSSDNADALTHIWTQHTSGDRQVCALFGPTGSGKTSVVYDLAAAKGVGVFQYDAPGATTFIDWVGATAVTASGGVAVTEYQPSALMQVLDADGPYAGQWRIVLIDEVNRAESGAATNFLMSITHGVAAVYVPDAKRTIRIDPAAFIVFTGNMGSAYNATIPLDPALLDRMENVLHFDYPDEKAEVRILRNRVPSLDATTAERLVRAARQTRVVADRGEIEVGVSTRRLIAAAKKVGRGMKPIVAARICWANTYSNEGGERSPRAIVTSAIEGALR